MQGVNQKSIFWKINWKYSNRNTKKLEEGVQRARVHVGSVNVSKIYKTRKLRTWNWSKKSWVSKKIISKNWMKWFPKSKIWRKRRFWIRILWSNQSNLWIPWDRRTLHCIITLRTSILSIKREFKNLLLNLMGNWKLKSKIKIDWKLMQKA